MVCRVRTNSLLDSSKSRSRVNSIAESPEETAESIEAAKPQTRMRTWSQPVASSPVTAIMGDLSFQVLLGALRSAAAQLRDSRHARVPVCMAAYQLCMWHGCLLT